MSSAEMKALDVIEEQARRIAELEEQCCVLADNCIRMGGDIIALEVENDCLQARVEGLQNLLIAGTATAQMLVATIEKGEDYELV